MKTFQPPEIKIIKDKKTGRLVVAYNYQLYPLQEPPKESPVWTALYTQWNKRTPTRDNPDEYYDTCYHVEFGDPLGPPFNQDVADILAINFLKENAEELQLYSIRGISPYTAKSLRW